MKRWIAIGLLVVSVTLSGCAFKSKYGTIMVTMTHAEIAELYHRMSARSPDVPMIETTEGVIVKVK